jgi:hypothetical protein
VKVTTAALVLLSVVPALADESSSPEGTARRFYAVYSTFHPSDGIPDSKARAEYEPLISPALEKLLESAEAAEARFTGANKDAPPLLDGDLFTSNLEGATSYDVGSCSRKSAIAQCRVSLIFDPGNGNKLVRWTDTLLVVETPLGWRIDDIIYGATSAYGNKGRLSETLNRAIADSGG